MDPHGGVEGWYLLLAKKSLHFLALLSLFSFLYSNDLHFSSFAHSVDRKYMFLICHVILAFLLRQMPPILLPENVATATVEYDVHVSPVAGEEDEETEQQHEHSYGDMMAEDEVEEEEGDGDMTADDQVEEDEGDGELEEDEDEKLSASAAEEVSDARVSTEELNQKCEEFIRKMKEEIRIEAHQ